MGERERGWGTPVAPERRQEDTTAERCKKRVGVGDLGTLRQKGAPHCLRSGFLHLVDTLQSWRRKLDFGSRCCAIPASSFPSLASVCSPVYWEQGEGLGASAEQVSAMASLQQGGSSLCRPS